MHLSLRRAFAIILAPLSVNLLWERSIEVSLLSKTPQSMNSWIDSSVIKLYERSKSMRVWLNPRPKLIKLHRLSQMLQLLKDRCFKALLYFKKSLIWLMIYFSSFSANSYSSFALSGNVKSLSLRIKDSSYLFIERLEHIKPKPLIVILHDSRFKWSNSVLVTSDGAILDRVPTSSLRLFLERFRCCSFESVFENIVLNDVIC